MKAKRKSYMIFMNVGTHASPTWEVIGRDNEDLSKEMNNNVNSFTNVLGETEVEITKGNRVISVDPIKFRDDSSISSKLYDIYKNDLELSDVEHEFLEVNTTETVQGNSNAYGAFVQVGAIDLKSWGGDTSGLNTPFDINFKGEKTFGVFNPTTKVFTPEDSASV